MFKSVTLGQKWNSIVEASDKEKIGSTDQKRGHHGGHESHCSEHWVDGISHEEGHSSKSEIEDQEWHNVKIFRGKMGDQNQLIHECKHKLFESVLQYLVGRFDQVFVTREWIDCLATVANSMTDHVEDHQHEWNQHKHLKLKCVGESVGKRWEMWHSNKLFVVIEVAIGEDSGRHHNDGHLYAHQSWGHSRFRIASFAGHGCCALRIR